MTQRKWKAKIKKAATDAGTYKKYFEPVIDTLAGILSRRDDAQKVFEESGCAILLKHTNKGGSTYFEQNPALRALNDLNWDALAYWRDLGLTPAGLKRIDEQALKTKPKSALDAALEELGG